jgi:hypothetical protein
MFTARYGLDILCLIQVRFFFKVFTEHKYSMEFFKFGVLVPRITRTQNSLNLPSRYKSLRFFYISNPIFSSEERGRIVGWKWRSHLSV